MEDEDLSRDRYAREHGLPTDAELHDLKVTAAERARIRQLALDEAKRIDRPGLSHGHTIENGAAAGALRDFAVLLEDR